jgi:hypothetical protein
MTAIRTSLVAIGLATSWSGPSARVFAQTSDSTADSVRLLVASEPAGASIFVQNQSVGLTTPGTIYRLPGETLVEVMLEGYEPLATRIKLDLGQTITLHFMLKSFPPPPLPVESLGLAKLPILSLMNEKIAEQAKKKWSNLAEIFAIVPLGQGILAKLLLPSEQQNSANAMIISGVVLTVGTHIVSKAVGKHRLRWVRQRNQEIPAENDSAARHNAEIDKMVTEANEQATDRWLRENEKRGVVTVFVE